MALLLGIRREDKNEWERRVPIVPNHVRELKKIHKIDTQIQPSKIRIFGEDEYKIAGAEIKEDLVDCQVVFAVKEPPLDFFKEDKTYIFFSHTIKGQKHNMPMLKKLMELKCNLIDYEKIAGGDGKRLVFFGRYAGFAGMIDTLWALGKRLESEGITTPLLKLKKGTEYKSIHHATEEIKKVAAEIKIYGFDNRLVPLTCAFLGYGHVSQGAQELFDLFPHEVISPEELLTLKERPNLSRNIIYKVVFKEEDLVQTIDEYAKFNLADYYKNPEKYAPKFEQYIEHLSMIVNGIYWDSRYPKFITKNYLKKLFRTGANPELRVISDITCDVEGSVECNLQTTDSGNPIYVYNPQTGKIKFGYEGSGVVVLAVDNLPCELPYDSSTGFSTALLPFIPEIIKADYTKDFKGLKLPPEIKNALILCHGEFTPDYKYLEKFL